MKDWFIYSIGFLAQILFSSRLIIQWITSEKQRKVITPNTFWTLSLIASFLLFIYGYLRLDFAIMLGQSLTYYIYIRNLQLQGQWQKFPKVIQYLLFAVPILIVLFYYNNNKIDVDLLFQNDAIPTWLLALGIVAQIVFTLRFVYQWIHSERHKASSLPLGFWVLSLIGAGLILTYAIIRKDPVLFIGHLFGLVIYARNAYLIRHTND
ncbi:MULTISPECIES: lipid-A-disaccharide synthase N-terminal domain-containing protein [Winogradskyella]|uniref:lipid-A-disaccharide synthase N-terminal domain-containing protein n=1 Tax=Winogradskyella TaxID=286104 RepID=UPI0015CE54C9|nr:MULTISPECIES: lipid-A-disaccharide synthase N-terminal domain-containing protein [Winogradskyella]QNK78787.1 lipid-A-disaccharide synthase N-terminal domain-containing protein [Winogradskyella sp. PAMC22761]QXP78178.1 lipid-A-disaccharide synthase N-terminal domain-containing protein [Winogradskyella sp. HaHa_3_26]